MESELKMRGRDVQTIEDVKSVLGRINFEKYGGRDGLMALLKTVGRHDAGEEVDVTSLTIELEESIKDFLALDAVESSRFYRDARLPRSLPIWKPDLPAALRPVRSSSNPAEPN